MNERIKYFLPDDNERKIIEEKNKRRPLIEKIKETLICRFHPMLRKYKRKSFCEILDEMDAIHLREMQADPQQWIDIYKRTGIRPSELVCSSFYESDLCDTAQGEGKRNRIPNMKEKTYHMSEISQE